MLICDSESSGFKWEADKIWVIACYAIEEKMWSFSFDDSVLEEHLVSIKEWEDAWLFKSHEEHVEYLNRHSVCFHNYFQHDKPLIKKLYPWFQPKEEHDSYILSQLFNPDREIPKGCKGAHGLDAWSKRVGREGKVMHEDWSKFSPEMLHRVIEDVKDNVAAWNVLMQEKKEWEDLGYSWEEAIKLEYGIADLQGTGSITVKVAALFLDKWCRRAKMEAQQIIIYHDEVEYELPVHEKEQLEELAKKAFVKAGEYLKIRVPVTGSPKFGSNWKMVH